MERWVSAGLGEGDLDEGSQKYKLPVIILISTRDVMLEKEMATHSSILAWRISWTEESDRLQSMGLQESDTT